MDELGSTPIKIKTSKCFWNHTMARADPGKVMRCLSLPPYKRIQVPSSYWRQPWNLIATLAHMELTPPTACKYLYVQSSLRKIMRLLEMDILHDVRNKIIN